MPRLLRALARRSRQVLAPEASRTLAQAALGVPRLQAEHAPHLALRRASFGLGARRSHALLGGLLLLGGLFHRCLGGLLPLCTARTLSFQRHLLLGGRLHRWLGRLLILQRPQLRLGSVVRHLSCAGVAALCRLGLLGGPLLLSGIALVGRLLLAGRTLLLGLLRLLGVSARRPGQAAAPEAARALGQSALGLPLPQAELARHLARPRASCGLGARRSRQLLIELLLGRRCRHGLGRPLHPCLARALSSQRLLLLGGLLLVGPALVFLLGGNQGVLDIGLVDLDRLRDFRRPRLL
mmetsp:Transcript_47222/g.125301  ORF Transcript_47222/g.125301 Transcript_47222/m.125301 type:complete len:295 (+) Transcript_47222:1092-1976(+)